MIRHLTPQQYAILAAQDRQATFVCPPPVREFEGTRPFAEPVRPQQDARKQNAKQGEPI